MRLSRTLLSRWGKVPWAAVIDFDSNSELTGLYKHTSEALEKQRFVHPLVKGDRPLHNPDRATYWFFARGRAGRQTTIQLGKWLDWKKDYGAELGQQLRSLAQAVLPAPISGLAVWYRPEMTRHLSTAFEEAVSAFGQYLELVIVTDNLSSVRQLSEDYEAQLVEMPVHELCSGIGSLFQESEVTDTDKYEIPSSSGAPITLSTKNRNWLEEELEIVHLGSGDKPIDGRDIGCKDFLRGAELDWFDLAVHCDVERDLQRSLEAQVRSDLSKRRTTRISLYHEPGAGGSSVGRRLIWNLHARYPSVVLHRTVPSETASRIFFLASQTNLAVLVLIDGSEISERKIDEIYELLRSQNVAATILMVLRRFSGPLIPSKGRSFYLSQELSRAEAHRFRDVFCRARPDKQSSLEGLVTCQGSKECSAFFFGLVTYEEDYIAINRYVEARVNNVSDTQKKILAFIALAHRYAQRPIKSQAFSELLGIPKSRIVKLFAVMSDLSLELLVETSSGHFRTAHNLIAEQILMQILWPMGSDRRQWKQNLSIWAKDFATFCRGSDAIPNEEMTDLAYRTFIFRDNVEVLGTEKSASRNFAQLLEDVRSREGRLEILRHLTILWPDESHYWAHLGRYYALEMREYDEAIECLEKALSLSSEDPVLYHMHGMVHRYKMYEFIEGRSETKDLLPVATLASESFERSRAINPDNVHAYISEAQMLIRLAEYAGRDKVNGVVGYLSERTAEPYLIDCLERIEELLAFVRRYQEGEGINPYEEDCRAKLDALYGQHDKALQTWDNLLGRKETFKPPVRRQIVHTLLLRKERFWDRLSEREALRIVSLMEDNLREDPYDGRNLRLWVQAVRRTATPPSVESVIERVAYWRAASNSLDSIYYLYIFHVLLAIDGFSIHKVDAEKFIEDCSRIAQNRTNRTRSFEWLGPGSGVSCLRHHSLLGAWNRDKEFWENYKVLERCEGIIDFIAERHQAGKIELSCGLKAFFVPGRSGHFKGRSEGQRVSFYLGFSYDGLRAWEVKDTE
jgi:tetratricopeptide (TPR) repeat protein